MFEKLTTNHCLYTISEETLKLFKETSTSHKMEENIYTTHVLNPLDSHANVLQIWCLLNENDLKLVFDPDKMMSYSCNYLVLNLLRSNKKVQQFLKARESNQNIKFVLAYYLGYVTLQWVYELTLEHELGPALNEIIMYRNYYLLHEEDNLNRIQNHSFFNFQRTVTNLMATDSQKTNRFQHYIDTAIHLTRTHLYTQV